jgi:hypothetical protein
MGLRDLVRIRLHEERSGIKDGHDGKDVSSGVGSNISVGNQLLDSPSLSHRRDSCPLARIFGMEMGKGFSGVSAGFVLNSASFAGVSSRQGQ